MKNIILLCIILFYQGIGFGQTPVWSTHLDTATTFSSPRSVHLNNDGIADIVMGGGLDGVAASNGIVALDGATGNVLWNFPTPEEIFASAKFQDITGDNIPDVFIGGRYAEFYAIDGATGAKIWEFFPHPPTAAVDSGWFNFYSPQWIPDQNNDGKQDILVANGGNHALPSWITNRDPGYLMVLDAATGAVLAKDTMPDGEETYCSAVVADLANTSNLDIIFGSGGEDDGGSLWRVPLADLMNNDISGAVALATHATRGFIAPPSLADMNSDGNLDIISQAYDGTVRVFDGTNNQLLWSTANPGTESSAAPTIGNFTGDLTPDVFTVLAKGHAPSFSDYYQVLMDGATGNIVWIDSIAQLHFASANAVDLNLDGRDEALVSLNYHNGSNFSHQLMSIDFANNVVSPFTLQEGGVNLGSTPLVQDIDSDGNLDFIYAYRADSLNPMGQNGFKVTRLTSNYPVPGVGVAWGGYMGTNDDGLYSYLGVICGSINSGIVFTNISCNGAADASVSVSPTGGTGPYTFQWSTGEMIDTLGALDVGAYTLRITDSTGCYVDEFIHASDPYVISFGGLSLPSCSGDSNAVITVNSTGCPCMFSGCIFTWSNNGSTTKVGAGLWAGWQYVTITHLDGCVVVDSVLIPDAPPVIDSAAIINIPCYNYSTGLGAIDVALSSPYPTNTSTFIWSNTKTSDAINGLTPGNYSVTVTTAANCVDSATYTITVADTIQETIVATDPICNNDSTGQILISSTGGQGNHMYVWSPNDTTNNLTNLPTGYYSVAIIDSVFCVKVIDSIFLDNPPVMTASVVQTVDLYCNNDSTGQVQISAVGGVGTLQYNWSSGTTTQNQSNLPAGYHSVTITDSVGCTQLLDSILLNEPSAITGTMQGTDPTSGCNGTASMTPAGGIGAYYYNWSNGETSADITGLCAGTYIVTVTDDNGCTYIDSVELSIGTNVQNIAVNGDNLIAYPNPVDNLLWLEGSLLNQELEITIIDALGRVVKNYTTNNTTTKMAVETRELVPGHYSLLLRAKGDLIGTELFIKR